MTTINVSQPNDRFIAPGRILSTMLASGGNQKLKKKTKQEKMVLWVVEVNYVVLSTRNIIGTFSSVCQCVKIRGSIR
jgi:hypothetical protein